MGIRESKSLKVEEIEEVKEGTCFTTEEIRKLYYRFSRLDKEGCGYITKKEFEMIPELAVNPLASRILNLFDPKQNGLVNFKDFIKVLNMFHKDNKEKSKQAFLLYDIDQDGFISQDDLFQILKMMVGNNLDEKELNEIVTDVIKQADENQDGKISPQEFDNTFSTFDEIKIDFEI